jgi:zinc transport system permease protein
MIEILTYEFMQRAILVAVLIGIGIGSVGPHLVLRRLSLLGDGLAHLAFAGIALGFLLNINPMLTAFIMVILGSLFIRKLIQKNVYGEAAIALVLSFGIGVGVTIIGATKGFGTDLFSYLIGSILTTSWQEVGILSIITVGIVLFTYIFRRELLLLSFQQDVANIISKKSKIVDYCFSILIALITLLAIQAVGILLVTALLVIPTLIALEVSKSFSKTKSNAIIICSIVCILGILGSYYLDVPPSGLIVLLLLSIYGGVLGIKQLNK